MRVFVYKNLHKNCWSVKALEGENKGKVIRHSNDVSLENCEFRVQKGGQAKVRETKKKHVHAGVVGFLVEEPQIVYMTNKVTYNPYKYDTFVDMEGNPVYNAMHVRLTDAVYVLRKGLSYG